MNATPIVAERVTNLSPDAGSATLLGLDPLVRKDFREWARGKRAWVTTLVVAPILALTAANGAINHWIIANVPTESGQQIKPISMDPTTNFLAAIGTQFVIMAAIFATMSLMASERESGTLAWTASKPVSRLSIWVSKWITASATLFVAAVLVPVAVTVVVTVALYGPLDPALVVATIVGARGHHRPVHRHRAGRGCLRPEPGRGGVGRAGRPVHPVDPRRASGPRSTTSCRRRSSRGSSSWAPARSGHR